MKTVYVVMNAEFIHPGHINILKIARALGEVTVGIATDEFAARYKRLPLMSYEQRKTIVENIQGVKKVIPQDTLNLTEVLRALKPDYFVHGDDWKTGRLATVRAQVIEVLSEWGGQLVEPAYTEGVSSTQLNERLRQLGNLPENRLHRFRRLLTYQSKLRIIEVHDGLSASIVEHTQVRSKGKPKEFDAMCFPLPTDASRPGVPPFESEGVSSRIGLLHEILEVTTKPIIVEEGYLAFQSHFPHTVKRLERLGVAAVIVEDTLSENDSFFQQIASGKNAQVSNEFAIFVKLTSKALSDGSKSLIQRVKHLIEAGIDALIIDFEADHSDQGIELCQSYSMLERRVPLLVSPAIQSPVEDSKWEEMGIQGVVYRDQLLRAAYHSMKKTAESILLKPDSDEIDQASPNPCVHP